MLCNDFLVTCLMAMATALISPYKVSSYLTLAFLLVSLLPFNHVLCFYTDDNPLMLIRRSTEAQQRGEGDFITLILKNI